MPIEDRYKAALEKIPAPGGNGCHAALLGVASLAIMAGRDDGQALAEIRAAIPRGKRRVPDREITDAIQRAHRDIAPHKPGGFIRPIPQQVQTAAGVRLATLKADDSAAMLRQGVLEKGGGPLDPFGAEIWEKSPVRPPEPYGENAPYTNDMLALLDALYQPEDLLYIGGQYNSTMDSIRPAADWLDFFSREQKRIGNLSPGEQLRENIRLGARYPFIIPNPLTGLVGKTQSGKDSFRADSCIKAYRYIVVEFDKIPMEQQAGIIRGISKQGLRIAAMIFSGGKSLHAWICADGVSTADEWREQIKENLFPVLGALGADTACSNPARLSRLPGVFRAEKGKWQMLLYLAPGGGVL